MRDELDKKINAILDCPGCDERDQRIAELEERIAHIDERYLKACQEVNTLTADNTRLREALRTVSLHLADECIQDDDGNEHEAYICGVCKAGLSIDFEVPHKPDCLAFGDQALAPQPEKEGE